MKKIKYIDLFCGIGGFRIAMESAAEELGISSNCVFSCDIDIHCQKSYEQNFHEMPFGDISNIDENDIPDHDILLAGFPCQPFSVIGQRKGFEDTRGTLFFDIARIVKAKKPFAFVLENVKLLAGHNKGKTLSVILETLYDSGYFTTYRILNALDFGLPQKRERIFIVGFKDNIDFEWPNGGFPRKSLGEILERKVPEKFYASDYIRKKRFQKRDPTKEITIWHENKSGNISAYPYSCALRAGASYNYLLVNGERRLTPREMLRLQGFPDSFKIARHYSQTRKQAGNSLPIPVAKAIIHNVIVACGWGKEKKYNLECSSINKQYMANNGDFISIERLT
ncbi:DNA (cytosine-5-)-methyltransferase [Candidatus Sumerlaeota bacterium]|nr:DNA (cytosine-5-)-methyltransferase [Candidatus Sumerlaeota bacterium]